MKAARLVSEKAKNESVLEKNISIENIIKKEIKNIKKNKFQEIQYVEEFERNLELHNINDESNLKESNTRESNDDNSIKLYLKEIRNYKLLTFEEEKDLSKKIQENDDKEALNKLINSNLRLVVKIARNYISKGYPFIDVIQDGNMGLIKAANKYDYKKNVRFSTYASWWIKQTIVRNISIKKRMIRLSHRKEEKLRKIKKVKNKFYQQNKEMPTDKKIAELLNISEKEIKEIVNNSNNIVYIDDNVTDDPNFTLQNMISDNSYTPDNMVENKILSNETENIMKILDYRERIIVSYRHGFNNQNKKYTLKKIGEMFNISAETVRQIEIKALKKIRYRFPHLEDFLK